MREFRNGTVEGTGSAINIELGFTPDYVKVINEDGTDHVIMEWTSTMPAASGVKTVAAGTHDVVASDGISVYAGTEAGFSEGFTIGADSDLNASAETLHWIAMRSSV